MQSSEKPFVARYSSVLATAIADSYRSLSHKAKSQHSGIGCLVEQKAKENSISDNDASETEPLTIVSGIRSVRSENGCCC